MIYINLALLLVAMAVSTYVYTNNWLYIQNEKRLAIFYDLRFRLAMNAYRGEIDEQDERYRFVMKQINLSVFILRGDFPFTLFVQVLFENIQRSEIPNQVRKVLEIDDCAKNVWGQYQNEMQEVIRYELRPLKERVIPISRVIIPALLAMVKIISVVLEPINKESSAKLNESIKSPASIPDNYRRYSSEIEGFYGSPIAV
jgi:hypothetical protein